jgi:Tol biopolymer transport system component
MSTAVRGSLLLALGALALLPSAAAAPSAQIAFTSLDVTDHGDVVLLGADGAGLVNLTPGQANTYDDDRTPSWSPDGARIAFTSHRDGASAQEIFVMNADGTGSHRLTTDSGTGAVFNVDPAWSPDGARIAWRKAGRNSTDEIWVMNVDGAAQKRLTSDAGDKTAPQWSPDSTRLLYARRVTLSNVFVVDAAGGAPRDLTTASTADATPRWSPDGTRIALDRNDRIWVVDADGGNPRQVSSTTGLGPAWSPDGTRIAFTGTRLFPQYGSRYGPASRSDVFVVGADGKDERRLTGPLADTDYFGAASAGAPTWWPDGTRLFYTSTTTWVMNADGTCEGPFSAAAPRLVGLAWRPGVLPGLPAIGCADLRVQIQASTDAVGLKQAVVYHIQIDNDGNLAATDLKVEVSAPAGVTLSGGLSTCTRAAALVCTLPTLPAGRTTALEVYASSPRAGTIQTVATASADPPDSEPSSNTARTTTTVLPCTIVGTFGNDAINGTRGRDVICARAGWDRINALGGNDSIDAGNGNDTIDAGKGRDTVFGGGGLDVILVRDGQRDVVDCGTENDFVVADAVDRIAKNCEQVIRA